VIKITVPELEISFTHVVNVITLRTNQNVLTIVSCLLKSYFKKLISYTHIYTYIYFWYIYLILIYIKKTVKMIIIMSAIKASELSQLASFFNIQIVAFDMFNTSK